MFVPLPGSPVGDDAARSARRARLLDRAKPPLPTALAAEENHKDLLQREYRTVHEENQTQRNTIRDQRRIIDQQKVEIQRLNAELKARGEELAWSKQMLAKLQQRVLDPLSETHTYVDHGKVGELEADIAARSHTVDGLKAEILQARAEAQRVQEANEKLRHEYETLEQQHQSTAARLLDAQAAVAKQEHEKIHSAELRLIQDLRTESESLQRENAQYLTNLADLRNRLVFAEQQVEETAERFELLKTENSGRVHQMRAEYAERLDALTNDLLSAQSELRRVDGTLVNQIQELRSEISTFRDAQEHAAASQREKIADLTLKNELLEGQLREMQREKKLSDEKHAEAAQQSVMQLENQRRAHQEEASKLQEQYDRMGNQLHLAVADKLAAEKFEQQSAEKLKVTQEDLTVAQRRARELESEKQKLELQLQQQISSYTEQKDVLEGLRAQLGQLPQLQAELRQAHADNDDAAHLITELESKMELLTQENVRLSQVEVDASLPEVALQLARSEASEWRRRFEELEAETAAFADQLHAENTSVAAFQTAKEQHHASQLDAVQRQHEDADRQRRAEIEDLRATLGNVEGRLKEEVEGKEAYAKALRDTALKELTDRFDRERKRLMERVKAAEAQQTELEKSLSARATELAQENADKRRALKDLNDKWMLKQRDWEASDLRSREELAALHDKKEDERKRAEHLQGQIRELQKRITELEAELEKMRHVQLHW